MSPATGGGWDTGKIPLEICPDPAAHALPARETTLDEAWAAAEKALPEGWEVEVSVGGNGNRDLYTAKASYCYSLRHYRENVGPARFTPFEMEHAATPAAALLALAAALGRSGSGECGAVEPGPIRVGVAHVCDAPVGHAGDHQW